MGERGFGNHRAMGAAFLGMGWLAIYLPRVAPLLHRGGLPAGLAVTAALVGILGGPLLLILVEGDEGFGLLGLLAALLLGWLGARAALSLGAPPLQVDLARLAGAALGPLLLFGGFEVLARAVQKRG